MTPAAVRGQALLVPSEELTPAATNYDRRVMFGDLIGKAVNGVGDVVDGASKKVERFVDDPVKETADTVTQPVRDGLEVIDGLTEGELRHKAALRLGADAASGMALGELVDWYEEAP